MTAFFGGYLHLSGELKVFGVGLIVFCKWASGASNRSLSDAKKTVFRERSAVMSPVSEASIAFSAANDVSIDVFRERSEQYSLFCERSEQLLLSGAKMNVSRERSEQCFLCCERSEH